MCIFATYTYSCGHPCFQQRQWARCPHLSYKERQPDLITPCPDLRRTFWRVYRWCNACTLRVRRQGGHVPAPAEGKLRKQVAEKLRVEFWRDGNWVEEKLEDASEENEPMERELMLAMLNQDYVPEEEEPAPKPRPKRHSKKNIKELRERFDKSSPKNRDRRVRILSPDTGEVSSPGVAHSDPSFYDSALGSDLVETPAKEEEECESEESEEL